MCFLLFYLPPFFWIRSVRRAETMENLWVKFPIIPLQPKTLYFFCHLKMDVASKVTSHLTNLGLTFILQPKSQGFSPISATTTESYKLGNDLKSHSKYFFRTDRTFGISWSRICHFCYNALTQAEKLVTLALIQHYSQSCARIQDEGHQPCGQALGSIFTRSHSLSSQSHMHTLCHGTRCHTVFCSSLDSWEEGLWVTP